MPPQQNPSGEHATSFGPATQVPSLPQVLQTGQAVPGQSRVPPQPSGAGPHALFGQVVRHVQPQTFVVPPPPQVWGAVQSPSLQHPRQVPLQQAPLAQSPSWAQALPRAQVAPHAPPQSSSVSVPFFIPSLQAGA